MINNKIYLLIYVYSFYFVQSVHSQCEKIHIRKNIKSLTTEEWSDLLETFKRFYSTGVFEDFARVHSEYFGPIHDKPQFLPWHRFFIFDFENYLRSINPRLTLPYWDSAADFSSPHLSLVFSREYFGANGDRNNDYCVNTGFQRNITLSYPNNHCLRRSFRSENNQLNSWQSPELITSIIQSTSSYDEFRKLLEHSLHNTVHYSVGGPVGDFGRLHSPNDALFFLHHANIDRIWAKWQKTNRTNVFAMNGNHQFINGSFVPVHGGIKIAHYNVTINDTLMIGTPPLCYTYDDITSSRHVHPTLAEIRLRRLSKRTLRKYFPKLATNSKLAFDYDLPEADNYDVLKPLPMPTLLPKAFFEQHSFNVREGMKIQEKIRQFILRLNAEHYYSPYILKSKTR